MNNSSADVSETSKAIDSGYTPLSRVLHWMVAGGIVLQYLLSERAEEAADNGLLSLQLASLAQHKSIGITVLLLVFVRVLWRWHQPPPPLPRFYREQSPLLVRVSGWTHGLLYLLLVFLPVSGWLMSSASAYSVSWFGLLTLPDLIGANEGAKETLRSAHHLAAKVLFVLALLHIAAAFKHLWIDKSGVMGRMASTATVGLFAATVTAGVWFTWPTNPALAAQATESLSEPIPEQMPKQMSEQRKESVAEPASSGSAPQKIVPPLWNLDDSKSYIHFAAEQAGAAFTGSWQRFSAAIHFDEENLANSRAVVKIDATSVATKDSERDSTLAGADWFDTGNFAEIIFTAEAFQPLSSGATHDYLANASLSIRGKSYPIEFQFSVQRTNDQGSNGQITLLGSANLDRLLLNLGTIEWADTEWVGQFVEVTVKVVASVP